MERKELNESGGGELGGAPGAEPDSWLRWLGKCFTVYIIDFVLHEGAISVGPSHSAPLRFDPVVSCRVIDEVTRMVS